MMGSTAPSISGSDTCSATWMGCSPSSDAFHSSNDWNTSGTAHRYGRFRADSVSTALSWSCDAGPPTSAKPVRLMTESGTTAPLVKNISTGTEKSSPPE